MAQWVKTLAPNPEDVFECRDSHSKWRERNLGSCTLISLYVDSFAHAHVHIHTTHTLNK